MKWTYALPAVIPALLLGAFVMPKYVAAATSTGTLEVTASVVQKCNVSAPTLAFGNYDPVTVNAGAPLNGTTLAKFECTRGSTGVYVTANTGQNGPHATGTCAVAKCTRAMSDGVGNYLSYDLYTDAARTNVWNTTNTDGHVYRPVFTSGRIQSATVYGQIPAAEDVPGGNYTDSVEMVINF